MSRFLFLMLVFGFTHVVVGELFGQVSDLPMPPMPDLMDTPAGSEVVLPGSGQVAPSEEGTLAPVVGVRDPFWPVGYTPKVIRKSNEPKAGGASPKGSVVEVPEPSHTPQWDEARRKLDIRGISLIGRDKSSGQPKFLAMVTGRLVEKGDVVNVTHEDRVYRWKIVGIGKGGVSFQKLDIRQE